MLSLEMYWNRVEIKQYYSSSSHHVSEDNLTKYYSLKKVYHPLSSYMDFIYYLKPHI